MTSGENGSKLNLILQMIKTKFVLTLLALNGLLVGTNSASASTGSPAELDRQITNFSQTISELVGFDRAAQSLLISAIDRALIAQKVNVNVLPLVTAGVPISPTDPRRTNKAPTIIGEIATPSDRSIGQTKIEKTTRPQPSSQNNNQTVGGIKKKVNKK
jgi:hypothetical protein